jgi:CRISPR/Cas system-associated exonuclease Cas4 (RecB family)
LQRAERVALIYNSDADKFGGGEKSRFILQTEYELPHLFKDPEHFEKTVHTSLPAGQAEDTITVEKTQDVLDGIRKKADSGFSASSLNVYRSCPLKFYFSEVLGLRDLQEIEPDIEFNKFGIAIHGVLENIYSHFLGKNIDPAELKKFIPKAGMLLDKELAEIYKGGNTKTGKNHLIYEVAKKYIVQFLKYEAGKSGLSGIQIVGLEERIKETARLGDYEVTLKGFLDRVERTETGDLRIIDYKTGKVEPNDLKLNDKTNETDQLADGKKEKLFQLLFYAYLYRLHSGNSAYPRLGIYSLRMLSSYGLIETDLPGGIDFFEDYLTDLIAEIFDPSVSFSQTEDDRICSYCDFKDICNR